jgi:hypothetical protein
VGEQPDTARRRIAGAGDRAAGEAPVLRLLREAKVRDLLASAADGADRFEASGVLAQGDWFWVIFDNVPHIARVDPALLPGRGRNALLSQPAGPVGYEDIAYDPGTGRYFVLVEAVKYGPGSYMAQVHEFDGDFRPVSTRWLDFPLDRPNKGLEGLSCVRRDGRTYLLGLCEGNRCAGGSEGRRPGGGRAHVFVEGAQRWQRLHTIHLPASLPFVDYSSISVSGERIAVVSQESSALWVGRFAPSTWDVADVGVTYGFPPDRRGRTVYGTVEGVSWMAADQVVVVSDRAKPTQPAQFRDKDQSIHVFALGEGEQI